MSHSLSRRRFLTTMAASVAACSLVTNSQRTSLAQDQPVSDTLPIIDTHQHLWDLNRFKLPWQGGPDLAPLRRSFLMSDYLAATKGLNIVKTVYMEVDVNPDQQLDEAAYVSEICERNDTPMRAAVVSGRPALPGFEAYLKKIADRKHIRGIRQVLHGDNAPPGYCVDPTFVSGIKLLGDMGKSFDLCVRAGEVIDTVKLVDQCPQTRFILDHCGNMSVISTDAVLRAKWQQGMKELAARPNVMCKVSGIVVTANKQWTPSDLAPNINFTLDTFGEDRVMFAGDWPVCTLRASFAQWLGALQQIVKDRPLAFRKKLFHDNAAKFYGI